MDLDQPACRHPQTRYSPARAAARWHASCRDPRAHPTETRADTVLHPAGLATRTSRVGAWARLATRSELATCSGKLGVLASGGVAARMMFRKMHRACADFATRLSRWRQLSPKSRTSFMITFGLANTR